MNNHHGAARQLRDDIMPFIIPFVYSLAGLGAGFGARIGWTLGGRAIDAMDAFIDDLDADAAAKVDAIFKDEDERQRRQPTAPSNMPTVTVVEFDAN